jgi:NAD(P)-dependent dehydrogenase (short-subunit alcohol dehydrogenase family)
VTASIRAKGGQAEFIAADLTAPNAADDLVAAAVAAAGPLDILVASAGVHHVASLFDTSDSIWRETMAVNLDAVFTISRAAARAMRERGGSVIHVASDAALVGLPRGTAYCASKGGVLMFSKAMALDCAPFGIRVNAVCPDIVETPMLEASATESGTSYADYVASGAADIPLGRPAHADEVADAIVFLASDRSSFMTGSALVLDGGYTAR